MAPFQVSPSAKSESQEPMNWLTYMECSHPQYSNFSFPALRVKVSAGKLLTFLTFFSPFFLLTVSVEFGRAVWLRFYPPAFPPCPNPSFVAHLGGVVVGLTLGVVVLQNYEQRLQEQSLFWIFFCVYTLFVLCAVFWNIFAYSLLDVRLPPPP